MWDGNMILAIAFLILFILLSENQCGMETILELDFFYSVLLVEREPMWDGNRGFAIIKPSATLVEREPMWDGNAH